LSGATNYTGATTISAGTLRRSFASGKLSYAEFTNTTLTAAFNATPVNGQTFQIFSGATTQTYATVSVTGAPGVVCAYDSPSSILRVVSGGSSGAVMTIVEAGSAYQRGDVDGTGTAARLYYPYGLSFDGSGTLWFTDSLNFKVKKMTTSNVVTTIAGSTQGAVDGTGNAAKFGSTDHLAVDSSGNVFVCDRVNHAIRKVTPAGVVTTFAGLMGTAGSTDGTGTSARFNTPHGICIDSQDNLWVVEVGNNTVRKITPAGVVTTFAGTAGTSGSTDGTGAAIRFNGPYAAAIDSSGNLYISDSSAAYGGSGATNGGTTIRKITSSAVSSTLCGAANVTGYTDAAGSSARFNGVVGMCTDSGGNVYVADRYNNAIRKITPAGVVSTVIGPNVGSYELNNPCGVAINSAGVLFIADAFGQVIRRQLV
jgi:sugar lactone lactonase YvrE